jgi:hypothetical protein
MGYMQPFSFDDLMSFVQCADSIESHASFLLRFAEILRSQDVNPEELDSILELYYANEQKHTKNIIALKHIASISSNSAKPTSLSNKNVIPFPNPNN